MTALQLFGAAVRNRRLQLGLTQKALASLTRLNVSYLARLERGERSISLLPFLRLATALKIPPSRLIEPLDLLPHLPSDVGSHAEQKGRIDKTPIDDT